MKISTLKNTPLPELIDCFSEAFKNYYVKMPTDHGYWKNRFKNARVRFDLSWGIFDDGKIVGYVLNAIDEDGGTLTAYNAGTGIVEAYRGNQYVDKMYEQGLDDLRSAGVKRCKLEVIDENARAIRVYERIGFAKIRSLKSYQGELDLKAEVNVQQVDLAELPENIQFDNYAWDFTKATVQTAGDNYRCYQVFQKENTPAGHFILNPENGMVAQLEAIADNWELLFAGIQQVCPFADEQKAGKKFRIVNVDESRTSLIAFLNEMGIKNTVNQFEMEMMI